MALKTLLVQNLRIIEQLHISLARDANVFIGENGAGKTSILEAVDILSRGRSFRERRIHPLLRTQASDLIVSGKLNFAEGDIHLGIQKSTKQTTLHVNQEKVASVSIHASKLPVVSIHPDSHQLIQGGARYRRNYLDWSTFHVKPAFLQHWRDYSKCLRQRNKALREQCSSNDLAVWTERLSAYGANVDRARSEIFDQLKPIFDEYSRILLPEEEVDVEYYRGWSDSPTLEQALAEMLSQERQSKTTRLGAHRADLRLFLNQQEAAATASRGQQKLIAASLLLAQIEYAQKANSQKCVVLLDDIRAELDQEHARALMAALQNLGCQVLITAIDRQQLELDGWQSTKLFHVKQGKCKAVER